MKPLVVTAVIAALGVAGAPDSLSAQKAASPAPATGASKTEGSPRQGAGERSRQKSETDARQRLDRDAVAALEQTQQALRAIEANHTDEAVAAIERASGKITILVGRNPSAALIPVEVEAELSDLAPYDAKVIEERLHSAERAFAREDYPRARLELEGLSSEIRLRTYHIPLATYPDAMRRAARLLDEKKGKEAAEVLRTALNTLVVTETRTPLPVLVAKAAVEQAQAKREKEKAEAQKLLTSASDQLHRAKRLGYAIEAPEYASLEKSISDLETQLGGRENTSSAFESLKNRINAFVDRLAKAEDGKGNTR